MRDALVLTYETVRDAIKRLNGDDFIVLDDFPNPTEFRHISGKEGANITYVSGEVEKGLLREYIPHKLKKNNKTYTVATESARFYYIIQISFFAPKKGRAQSLSSHFIEYIEKTNELKITGDKWQETMNIFLTEPPYPPMGGDNLWQCVQTWKCSAKLITESEVSSIDVSNLKFNVRSL